jgi:hypothetical protein
VDTKGGSSLMQQYHAEETVEATLSFLHGEKVKNVTATFAHVDDPDTKFHLSSDEPSEQTASEGAGYTYWRAVLSGSVTAEDKLGEYECEVVEARYSGGRKIAFLGISDVGFEIVEEDISPPEVIGDWEWGAGS